ncbi:MAG: polyprenyl synthetase family protein [Stagnimonas sp.]|nr:polyprenyl synthetase family protein [Stagnimonas sp.]
MNRCDFTAWEAARRARLHAALDAALPQADAYPARLHAAMRYACEGGKRLRALLVYATGEALGAAPETLDAPAVAVELIHAFSLVHDDLPAMDDDDLRRGRATVHIAYDEGTAILVGDALQALAFTVLASAQTLPATAVLEQLRVLAAASGSQGMTGGQQADLDAEGQTLALADLEQLHAHKTGALMLACVRMAAAAAADADKASRDRLDAFGTAVGLAYQIQDDVLDVEGSTASLGKTAGKDAATGKSTYVRLMGLAQARDRVLHLLRDSERLLEPLDARADPLRALIDRLLRRSS